MALVLLVLLMVWVELAPSESRLGNLVKLVYVHGALVWVGLGSFSVAAALGLVALLVRRRTFYVGSQASGLVALVLWIVYAISAVVVTGLTWGEWIAWGEPRVRATGSILIAALVLALATSLVRDRVFTAAANLLLGVAAWIVVRQAEVIRHPVDPIGASGSGAMQAYYSLIVATVAGLAAAFTGWLWLDLQERSERK